MAGRRFDVADVVEVLQHWQAGHSLRHAVAKPGHGPGPIAPDRGAAEADGIVAAARRSADQSGKRGSRRCFPIADDGPCRWASRSARLGVCTSWWWPATYLMS